MPQPGQGNPVSILNGQKDCSVSKCEWLLSIIKNGIISVINAPIIP